MVILMIDEIFESYISQFFMRITINDHFRNPCRIVIIIYIQEKIFHTFKTDVQCSSLFSFMIISKCPLRTRRVPFYERHLLTGELNGGYDVMKF